MPKQPKKALLNDSEYGKFLEGLNLITVALKSCAATLDRKVYWKAHEKGKRGRRKLSEDYRISYVGENYFDLEGCFGVTVSGLEAESLALKVECAFYVHIHSDQPNPEFVDRFTKAELRLLLLPYVRHFVTNITGQMDIRPVVIPLAIGPEEAHEREKGTKTKGDQ